MPGDTSLPARHASDELLAMLYAAHGSHLRRFAARLTGDHGRAEDITQETMLRAWRHPQAVDGSRGDPRPWLYTVARRVAVDQHRARQARPAEVAAGAALATRTAPDHLDAAITGWDLAAALESLPRRHRDLLIARYLRDHSTAEIAAALHIPRGTVQSRLAAARGALRQHLQAQAASTSGGSRPPAQAGHTGAVARAFARPGSLKPGQSPVWRRPAGRAA